MTDKQIIIDDVDVSKCIYFQQEDDGYTCGAEECNGAIVACRACDNCYYKQLKRKEQECEELRETIKKGRCPHYVLGECSQKHHNNCVGRNQCIKDLEQENEKLKVWKSITPLKTKMLVKALTEIKDIVETCNSGINCSECPYTKECKTDTEAEALGVCKLILQKCEVLDE